jgi:predicted RecA/RadA family phage recombinase
MEARFLHEGRTVDYTPETDIAAGSVVIQGSLTGIALRDLPAGQLGSLQVDGVFEIAKLSGDVFTAGTKVYWDAEHAVATSDTDDGGEIYTPYPYLGKTVEAAGVSTPVVRVRLDQ